MTAQWICVDVNLQQTKYTGLQEKIGKEAERIFGSDFLDLIVVGEDTGEEFSHTLCVFLKCQNYFSHVRDLKQSPIIANVVQSFDKPHFVPSQEIKRFQVSVDGSFFQRLHFCDIVIVRSGYLQGLRGIVVSERQHDKYKVFFRFYTRCFTEIIHRNDLVFEKSLFADLRVPVVLEFQKPGKTGRTPVMVDTLSMVAVHAYIRMLEREAEDKVHRSKHRDAKRWKRRTVTRKGKHSRLRTR